MTTRYARTQYLELSASAESTAAAGYPTDNWYGFSKAALNSLTMLQAAQLPPHVLVNACSPGFIMTDLTLGWMGLDALRANGALTPTEGTVSTMALLFGDAAAIGRGRYFGSDGLRSPLSMYRKPGTPAYEGEQ
jgi:NAD(P)-dependent dehydrogenase (short-subunit alcohol dehydrogenase family)